MPTAVKLRIAARSLSDTGVTGANRKTTSTRAEHTWPTTSTNDTTSTRTAHGGGRSRTVVVGGGFAGLATAGPLAQDGHWGDPAGAAGHLGGRSGVVRGEGFTLDRPQLVPHARGHSTVVPRLMG
ncbi:hypothetical protein QJS66_11805 [Kocuria rhizophila]|nr:hypothetical protein QJS66_11805 [Kocuria rhizophila]